MKNIRAQVKKWAEQKGFECTMRYSPYPFWQHIWCVRDEHLNIMLRLGENDVGVDIIIGSCSGGYGGNEKHWRKVNLGNAQSLEQIVEIYRWLETKATTRRD